MDTQVLKEKSQLCRQEALDLLMNKPMKSTMLERIQLLNQADEQVQGLSQPLQLGNGALYIAKNASVPVEPHDILLGRFPEKVPDEEEEKIYQEWEKKNIFFPFGWTRDGGHTTFAWEELIENGLNGLKSRVEKTLEKHKAAGADQMIYDFLEGKILMYTAVQTYISRYADAAEEAGLTEIAAVCRNIAVQKPATFCEALQLILFVGQFFSVYMSAAAALSYGRLDQILLPYYERDLESGILTEEQAGYLIDDFCCKNNLILGRGEHQLGDAGSTTGWGRNPAFDTPQYVLLGGRSNVCDPAKNPLTSLFLKRFDIHYKNPVYIYRYTPENNPADWELCCDMVRQNASILIYNDLTMIPAMMNGNIEEKDAIDYTLHSCNWPNLAGQDMMVSCLEIWPVERILKVLMNDDKTLRKPYASMDEIYDALFADYHEEVLRVYEDYRKRFENENPLPWLLTTAECFMANTAETTRCLWDGGVKYPLIQHAFRNVATAADILSAIDWVVFKNNYCTLEELIEACKTDFAGQEPLRKKCRQAPKYGSDDPFANAHAERMMRGMIEIGDRESVVEGKRVVYHTYTTTTDMWHLDRGNGTMATPDGRHAGEPLSENLSPTVGVTTGGVTALLNSAANLPLDHVNAGAFNVKMQRSWVSGDEGLERLKALLETFFENGGMQVQLSCTDAAELRAAQKDPEKYKDLMVRVTGYSAIFVDMNLRAQEEIIRRDEMAV